MQVASGLRCPDYNRKVGGVPKSAHMRGFAADILCADGVRRYWMARKAFELGFIGVGVHKHFIHLDMDSTLVRPAMWLY